MKAAQETDGHVMRIYLRGAIRGGSCNCLEHFWERHVSTDLQELHIDMAHVHAMDGEAVASMVKLLRRDVENGLYVVVNSAPPVFGEALADLTTSTSDKVIVRNLRTPSDGSYPQNPILQAPYARRPVT
jgi:hypothetical protein